MSGGEYNFLAIDLGAESGRGAIISLRDGKIDLEEIHRWPNRPVRLGGTLTWDFPFLFAEILQALKICKEQNRSLTSVGVDTWGVDFGLLGSDGKLLGNPVHYRDARTNGIHSYSEPTMSNDEIFALTGYEPWQISSLFQLLSMRRDKSPLLEIADTFLNTPDLLNYFLTGRKCNERSILNTSNLMDTKGRWAEKIIQAFSLPRKMFGEIIDPATKLGPLHSSLQEITGLGDLPVVAGVGHDTSAALAATPGQGDHWAFLSCGTWSILGSLVHHPVATKKCLELGYTNEYTLGGWYIGRNILGLWLVQELKRKWDTGTDPWNYVRMTAEAVSAGSGPLMDAADPSLMAPMDMEEAQLKLIRESGQPMPGSRGQLVRGVLESLALEYNIRLNAIGELTGTRPDAVYMIGGGIKNELLCRLTANACRVPVYAGVDQCTAVGNALGQAVAMGVLSGPQEIRDVVGQAFEMKTYEPKDASAWNDKIAKYETLRR
jgi:rhamnulokinase